jgi:hypothetical protein
MDLGIIVLLSIFGVSFLFCVIWTLLPIKKIRIYRQANNSNKNDSTLIVNIHQFTDIDTISRNNSALSNSTTPTVTIIKMKSIQLDDTISISSYNSSNTPTNDLDIFAGGYINYPIYNSLNVSPKKNVNSKYIARL